MTEIPSLLLRSLKPDDINAYLLKVGWVVEPFPRDGMIKYRSPRPINDDQDYIEVIVPSSETLNNYKWMMEHSLKIIASIEDKKPEDLIIEILNFADCIKTGIVKAKRGMLPLDRGVILYGGLFNLIMSGASCELGRTSKRSHKARARKYANSSLIGQSEYGSYVANIYIPLDRPTADFDFTIDPFQRKVVLRILRGLKSLDESATEENPEPIIKNHENGLNVDMCDALAGIIDAGMGNNVTIKAILEPAYASPEDILTEFTLTPRSKGYLESAIEALKERDKPHKKDGWWSGFPRVLDRSETAKHGVIKLETIDADEGHINIYIEFNEDDYKFCVDANLNKRQIQISGTLEKVNRRWVLHNPHDLAFIGGRPRSVIHHPKQESLKTYEEKHI